MVVTQFVAAPRSSQERLASERRRERWRLAAGLRAGLHRLLLRAQHFGDGQSEGVRYEQGGDEQLFSAKVASESYPLAQSSSGPGQELRAFEAFFRQHERQVVAFLWRMTGDEQTAHDLSQEVFIRAWRHFARIHDYEQPGAWLMRVATNLALTHLRGAGARATDAFGERDEPARSDPARRFVERDLVQRTLLELAPQQRASLVLREVYGFSCEEIGQTLGVSRGAVKMALLRGREQFRARYQRHMLDGSSGRREQGYGLGYGLGYGSGDGQNREGRR